MYLAYSAINPNLSIQSQTGGRCESTNNEQLIRYQAYKIACSKYADEIVAIQKYFPGWMPGFR